MTQRAAETATAIGMPHYTRVPDAVMMNLICTPPDREQLNATELKIVLAVIRWQLGFRKRYARVSTSALLRALGLESSARAHIKRALQALISEKHYLVETKKPTFNAERHVRLADWLFVEPAQETPEAPETLQAPAGAPGDQSGATPGDQSGATPITTTITGSNEKEGVAPSADARAIALSLFRTITKLNPPKTLADKVADLLTGRTEEEVRPYFETWIARGNKPTNLDGWLFDWFQNGRIPKQHGGNKNETGNRAPKGMVQRTDEIEPLILG